MISLVTRLRHPVGIVVPEDRAAMQEAANEIERLSEKTGEEPRPYCARCGYPCMRCNGGR